MNRVVNTIPPLASIVHDRELSILVQYLLVPFYVCNCVGMIGFLFGVCVMRCGVFLHFSCYVGYVYIVLVVARNIVSVDLNIKF